jgi:DNA-binding transcriptional ArsR family regulator
MYAGAADVRRAWRWPGRGKCRRSERRRPRSVALIDALLETGNDRQIAARLNELGHHNWRGEPFTMKKVMLVRRTNALKSRFERLRERGMITGEEVARQLGVSPSTVHQLGRQGLLTRHLYGNNHRCLYEPPGNVKLVKGAGSRYGGRPPRLTIAQPAGQGAS